MDNLSRLRMQNMFSPFPMNGDQPADSALPPATMQPLNAPDEIQSPEQRSNTPLSDQLTQLLGNMPQREEPGKLRSVAAAIAAFGAGGSPEGISMGQPIGYHYNPDAAKRASDNVIDAPYDKKLSDWATKAKALGIGATEEDRRNNNETVAGIKQQQIDVNQQRADAYQQNADTKIKEESDKHEYSMQKLADNVKTADAKLVQAAQKLKQNQNNIDNLKEYHQAELVSKDARTELMREDMTFKQNQSQLVNEARIKRMEILNQNNGTKQTVKTAKRDANGNIISTTSTTGPVGNSSLITDPSSGKQYDTSSWSDADKKAASDRGWK